MIRRAQVDQEVREGQEGRSWTRNGGESDKWRRGEMRPRAFVRACARACVRCRDGEPNDEKWVCSVK